MCSDKSVPLGRYWRSSPLVFSQLTTRLRIDGREVQVFREAVGLEVALLQTGATLEHPAWADHGMRSDAGQEPAERVVLLDDMRLQLQFGGQRHDLLLGDHGCTSRASVAGTQTRHAVASRSAGNAGSSLA